MKIISPKKAVKELKHLQATIQEQIATVQKENKALNDKLAKLDKKYAEVQERINNRNKKKFNEMSVDEIFKLTMKDEYFSCNDSILTLMRSLILYKERNKSYDRTKLSTETVSGLSRALVRFLEKHEDEFKKVFWDSLRDRIRVCVPLGNAFVNNKLEQEKADLHKERNVLLESQRKLKDKLDAFDLLFKHRFTNENGKGSLALSFPSSVYEEFKKFVTSKRFKFGDKAAKFFKTKNLDTNRLNEIKEAVQNKIYLSSSIKGVMEDGQFGRFINQLMFGRQFKPAMLSEFIDNKTHYIFNRVMAFIPQSIKGFGYLQKADNHDTTVASVFTEIENAKPIKINRFFHAKSMNCEKAFHTDSQVELFILCSIKGDGFSIDRDSVFVFDADKIGFMYQYIKCDQFKVVKYGNVIYFCLLNNGKLKGYTNSLIIR